MNPPSPAGLKPTLRQSLILIVWAALLFAIARASVYYRLLGDRPESNCLSVAIALGVYPMPMLAGLLRLLDRPGAVCRWYVSACMIAAHFVGGLAFFLCDPVCYAITGRPTLAFPMFPVVGLVGFVCGWLQWRDARPRCCPTCGHDSVIPVAQPVRPGCGRLVNTGKHGWCASCGSEFERDRPGDWRPSDLPESPAEGR